MSVGTQKKASHFKGSVRSGEECGVICATLTCLCARAHTHTHTHTTPTPHTTHTHTPTHTHTHTHTKTHTHTPVCRRASDRRMYVVYCGKPRRVILFS